MERTELSRRQVAMQRATLDLEKLPPQARPQELVRRAALPRPRRRVDAAPAAPRAGFHSGSRDTLTKELNAMAKDPKILRRHPKL